MHDHGHHHGAAGAAHTGSAGLRHRRALTWAFGLTAAYMVIEFVVGFTTGSLALLADAAHMGTDVLGLGMALAAIALAARPRTAQRTFGLMRLEVIAALANGVVLFVVAGAVIVEAVRRWAEPPEVPGWPLIATAVVGLAINLVSMRLLTAGQHESINVRGAYLEVLADAIGSVGVIVSAIVILTTGWPYADPIMGIAIGLFILPRTVRLMRQALRILIEAAPENVDVTKVKVALQAVDGVTNVHDLHVWTVTSGVDAASGHLELEHGADQAAVLRIVTELLRDRFGIAHATIQCEPPGFRLDEAGVCE